MSNLQEIGRGAYAAITEMVAALEGDREEAMQRIHEDALSVEVRSGWHTPGDANGRKPAQFNILIATGGPAVRIIGELDEHAEPICAWLEVQNWGTPWTEYTNADDATLLAYANCFYFGE